MTGHGAYIKRMRTLLLGLNFVLAFVSQGIDAPRISQEEFKKLFTSKNVIIVDTRNDSAYSAGHIPGAVLLPLEGLPAWPEQYEKTVVSGLLTTNKPIVTYCA
jgi:rhodanese-related sulfurtransferase